MILAEGAAVTLIQSGLKFKAFEHLLCANTVLSMSPTLTCLILTTAQ